jgi:hypothetical protein
MAIFKIQNLRDNGLGQVGEIIPVAVGVLSKLQGLFGKSSKDIANDKFIDQLVTYSQQAGFQGFTHGDVVHLMPGDWGNNYTAATKQFQDWLTYLATYPIGTNLTNILNGRITTWGGQTWGGGYNADHLITYHPQTQTTTVTNPTTGTTTQQKVAVPTSNMSFAYIAGGVLILGLLFAGGK